MALARARGDMIVEEDGRNGFKLRKAVCGQMEVFRIQPLPNSGQMPGHACCRPGHALGWNGLFAEVALQQTGEAAAVAGLILGHLVDGVVDGVEVELLGQLRELELAGGGAVLGVAAEFEVLLGGVGDDLAQQLDRKSVV